MQIAQEMPAQWRARHRGTEWEWVWESKWRQWRQQKKFDGNAGKEGKEDEDEHDDVTWCECRWQGKILKISYYEVDDNEARAIIHKQSLKFRAPLIGDWSLLCSRASECIFPECLQWRELPIVAGLPLTIFFPEGGLECMNLKPLACSVCLRWWIFDRVNLATRKQLLHFRIFPEYSKVQVTSVL